MFIHQTAAVNKTAGVMSRRQQVPRQILDGAWYAFAPANRIQTPANVQNAHGRVGFILTQQNGTPALGAGAGHDPKSPRSTVDGYLRNSLHI